MGPTEADYGNNVSGATGDAVFSFLPPRSLYRPRSSRARVRHFSLIALLLSAPLSYHPLDRVYSLHGCNHRTYAPLLFISSRAYSTVLRRFVGPPPRSDDARFIDQSSMPSLVSERTNISKPVLLFLLLSPVTLHLRSRKQSLPPRVYRIPNFFFSIFPLLIRK